MKNENKPRELEKYTQRKSNLILTRQPFYSKNNLSLFFNLREERRGWMQELKKIVLTGGPCAWKTSALCFLHDELSGKGWRVVTVPEVATLFFINGIKIGPGLLSPFEFQRSLLSAQLSMEDTFSAMLDKYEGPNKVLICDRGALDAKAYIEVQEFNALLLRLELTEGNLLSRYHAAIHLVTAADGAIDFYTLDNNPTRTETPEEARILDIRTQNAWVGHSHLCIIPNLADGLAGKKQRLLQAVCRVLGIPVPLEIELKFWIAPTNIEAIASKYGLVISPADIEQKYLLSAGDVNRRIRKKIQAGHATYYYTEKKRIRDGVRSEIERFMDHTEYAARSEEQEPGTSIIKKTRHYFIWKNQYFELDIFEEPVKIHFLEIELTEENQKVELPPFIKVIENVTNNACFTNHAIARGSLSLNLRDTENVQNE